MSQSPKSQVSGIYAIFNDANGKCYIGSSKNIKNRWKRHKTDLKYKKHPNNILQRAYNKYGADLFRFEILEHCDIDKLLIREQWYLDNFLPEYNIAKNATAPNTNIKMTDKQKLKLALASAGNKRYNAKLTWIKVIEIRYKYATGKYTQKELSEEYSICRSIISEVVNNKRWKSEYMPSEYMPPEYHK